MIRTTKFRSFRAVPTSARTRAAMSSPTVASQSASVRPSALEFLRAERFTDSGVHLLEGRTTVVGNVITFSSPDTRQAMFDVDGADLSTATSIVFAVPASATVLVNVSGNVVSFGAGGTVNQTVANNRQLIWSFTEAASLTFREVEVQGTVLAPFATVEVSNAAFRNHLIAGELRPVAGLGTGAITIGTDGRFARMPGLQPEVIARETARLISRRPA